jgi:hypothetical protein
MSLAMRFSPLNWSRYPHTSILMVLRKLPHQTDILKLRCLCPMTIDVLEMKIKPGSGSSCAIVIEGT